MRYWLFVAIVLAPLTVGTMNANAAPQMLGVVASAEPMPLRCEGGVCSIELSSFCLEKERSMPQDGSAYEVLDPSKLSLVVTAQDGTLRQLSAAGHVQITSLRGHVAVAVTMPESFVRDLGATQIAVIVAPDLALMPVAVANDPKPILPEEIVAARGAVAAASSLFERDDPRMRMVRVLNRLINAMPRNDNDQPGAERAWSVAVGAPFSLEQSDPVLSDAALVFASCRTGLAEIWPPGMRRCLQAQHDAEMGGINADVWKLIGAGS
jgi:hypothetical protein